MALSFFRKIFGRDGSQEPKEETKTETLTVRKHRGKKPNRKPGKAWQPGKEQAPPTPEKSAQNKEPKNKQASKKSPRKRGPSMAERHAKWDPTSFKVEPEEGRIRFHDLNLDARLMHAIADLGFAYCTPIQAEILPPMLQGKDAAGKAQTGTGKTAAFLIALYSRLLVQKPKHKQKGKPRALIIAPTRELAMQIEEEARLFGKYVPLNTQVVFGGMDYQKQKNLLHRKRVDILVATPGRLLDYHKQKDLDLRDVEMLVIDEADRMLDMGFIPDVRRILYAVPEKDQRQTLFFSATFNESMLKLAKQWTKEDRVHVEIEPDKVAAKNVDQRIYMCTEADKIQVIYHTLQQEDATRVIIFANRRDVCRKLLDTLASYEIPAELLSGEVPQRKRIGTLERFRDGKTRVIVATDVAGRGIHVENVSHVINFELPEEADDYVHRIGRTGRAGKKGVAISFASEFDAYRLMDIEEYIGIALRAVVPPESLMGTLPEPKALPEPKRHSKGKGPRNHHQRHPRKKTRPRGKPPQK